MEQPILGALPATEPGSPGPDSILPAGDNLLSALESFYESKAKSSEYRNEEAVYRELVPRLTEHLAGAYVLAKPIGLGSTATVWLVTDRQLGQKRALKLPRPRLGLLRNIVLILRAEAERLAALNHQNIVKIFSSGEVQLQLGTDEYSFPYFIMEFLDDVLDLDEFITTNYATLTSQSLLSYLRDILSGLEFLHGQGIIHCDLKPGNILIAPGRPALIADLGYAKHFERVPADKKETTVTYTPRYAHPELRQKVIASSDSAAHIAVVPRDQLRASFDLFALGRAVQEILARLREAEHKDAARHRGQSLLTRYQWLYLAFLSKRLLDGLLESAPHADDISSDLIPGLTERTMGELKYTSATDAIEDIEKLLHLYDLEGEVPELNPNLPTYIQIPHCQVPLTGRVQEVISHPIFARLGRITQLGFISLVYPGATHSRLEHVLGSFATCCQYLRALWYDQANCLFQMIMSARDVSLGLLAALVHDIGQYPMAHDLTEVDDRFSHERLTRQALEYLPGNGESLASVIASEWQLDIEEVISVLTADDDSPFRHRLLHSIISGPLDCDKLDYLRRDSTHSGVSFGLALDQERLLRNLTIIYQAESDPTSGPDGSEVVMQRLTVAEIGITEKALVIAKSAVRARRDMFTQVYWQHTVRAMKAMLGYVVRNVLLNQRSDADKAMFWSEFQAFVFSGTGVRGFPSVAQERPPESAVPDSSWEAEPSILDFDTPSSLSPSDEALLGFLFQFSDESTRRMLAAIRSRTLYRRLAVLSGRRMAETYDFIYNGFRAYRGVSDLSTIERQRQTWEAAICEEAIRRIEHDSSLLSPNVDALHLLSELRSAEPLILVDVPVKASLKPYENEQLWYLPEDFGGVHTRKLGSFPRFSKADIGLRQSDFDFEVGKIRILSHPRWCHLLARCLREEEVIKLIGR